LSFGVTQQFQIICNHSDMLKDLLAPYAVEQFLNQDWTRQAVHIPASDRHKFAHLFSWHTLNHLLNFHQLDESKLHFSLDGHSFSKSDRRNWHDHLQQGATLVINGVDERVPACTSTLHDGENDVQIFHSKDKDRE
jgi:hypothetical protein